MKADKTKVQAFQTALESGATRYNVRLCTKTVERLNSYYEFLQAWNPRLHLVAPCSPEEFATRHVLESLLLLPHLPENATIADIGSGAGLPIIPCLITRPDLEAILIESSKKKSVFLRECLNLTATSSTAKIVAARFQNVATPDVNFVTCRALDRFGEMFPRLLQWSPQGSTLLLFGGEQLRKRIESATANYSAIRIPGTQRRFLFAVSRA